MKKSRTIIPTVHKNVCIYGMVLCVREEAANTLHTGKRYPIAYWAWDFNAPIDFTWSQFELPVYVFLNLDAIEKKSFCSRQQHIMYTTSNILQFTAGELRKTIEVTLNKNKRASVSVHYSLNKLKQVRIWNTVALALFLCVVFISNVLNC